MFIDSTRPLIGVLVVTWNRRDDVLECVESVMRSTYRNLRVYVVDNASSDGTCEAVSDAYPEVTLIRSEENLGFAAGNNLGLSRMLDEGIDAALLVNDDVVLAKDAIELLLTHDNRSIAVLCPKVLVHAQPDRIWSAGGIVDPHSGVAVQRHYGEVDTGQADEVAEVDYAIGCAMLVKSEVIRRVGLLDPRYYLYYEESEWCRRIRDAGYKVIYVPRSQAWHKVSLNEAPRDWTMYYFSRNRLLYLRTGGMNPIRVGWIALSDILRSATAHAVKGRVPQSRLMVRGVIDYYFNNFGRFGCSL